MEERYIRTNRKKLDTAEAMKDSLKYKIESLNEVARQMEDEDLASLIKINRMADNNNKLI